MSNLKAFDGSWTCEGKAEASPFGPAGTMKGTVKSHTDLGGFWQSGMVKSTMAGMPGAMEGMFHMTYDPGAKQYVLLWVDNMGAYSRSPPPAGWQGDKIVFNGNMSMGGKKMGPATRSRRPPTGRLKHDWEGQIDGKWPLTGNETCRKGRRRRTRRPCRRLSASR